MSPGCPEVHRALQTGRALTPAERQHAAGCPLCGELVAQTDGPGGSPWTTASAVADRVLSQVAHGPPAGSRLSSHGRAAVVAATAAGSVGVVASLRGAGLPGVQTTLAVGLLAVAALAVATVSLTPVHRPSPAWTGPRIGAALGLPVLVAIVAARGVPLWDGVEMTWRCFAIGATVASVLFAVLFASERRARPSLEWTLGAAALAGLTGTLALDLSCGTGGLLHRVLGHAAVGLGCAGLVAAAFALRSVADRST